MEFRDQKLVYVLNGSLFMGFWGMIAVSWYNGRKVLKFPEFPAAPYILNKRLPAVKPTAGNGKNLH